MPTPGFKRQRGFVTPGPEAQPSVTVTPGPRPDPVPAFKRRKAQQDRNQPTEEVLAESLKFNPDKEAEAYQAAESEGIDPATASQYSDKLKDQKRQREIERALRQAPVTEIWVRNPSNARIAHDDVENLSALERLARAWERGQLIDQLGIAGSRLRDQRSAGAQAQVDAIQERLQALGKDTQGGVIGWLTNAGEVLGQQWESFTSQEAAIRMGGGAAIGATVGAAGGPLAPATSAAGAVTGLSAGAVSHLLLHSFEVEGGHAYLEMREQGVDEDMASWLSFGVGTINAGLELAGAAAVFKPFGEAGKQVARRIIGRAARDKRITDLVAGFAKQYGAAVIGETSTEVLQEWTAIAAEEWAKAQEGLEGATEEEIYERTVEIFEKTFKAMSVLAVPGPAINVATQSKKATQAERDRQVAGRINETAQASKLKDRHPDKFAEHLSEVVKAVGVEQVFVPGERLAEWASPEMLVKMGVADRVEEAVFMGEDVAISAESYAKYMLPSEDYVNIADHVRMDEDSMTMAEAEEFAASGIEEEINYLEAADEVIQEEPAPEAVRPEGEEFIARETEAQLSAVEEEIDLKTSTATAALKERLRNLRQDTERQPVTLAEAELGLLGLFRTADEAGMTPKKYQDYLEKLARASDASTRRQQEKLLKQQQRENTAQWQEEKQKVQREVSEELRRTPTYSAIQGSGNITDTDIRVPLGRLDREQTRVAVEGLGFKLEDLPRRGRKTIYAPGRERGVDVDSYAQVYGYDDAEQMFEDILTAPDFDEAAALRTDQIMKERHGDLLEQRQAILEARKSLMHDDSAAVLETELNALREARGQGRLSPKLIRQAARNRIKQMKVRDLSVDAFIRNAHRYAREAGQALRKGDRELAADLKFKQTLNFHMAKEAVKAQEQFEKRRKFLRKFSDLDKKHPNLPVEHLQAIRQLLDQVQFTERLGKKRLDKLQAQIETEKNPVKIGRLKRKLLDEQRRLNWRDLSVADFNELYHITREINHKGVTENKMLREREQRERDFIVASIIEKLEQNMAKTKNNKQVVAERTKWDKLKTNGADAAMSLFNIDSLLRQIDGFEELGVAFSNLRGRYDDALSRGYHPGQVGYLSRQRQEFAKVKELYDMFTEQEMKEIRSSKLRKVPGMDRKITNRDMLGVILNSGNDQNVAAMLESGTISQRELQAIWDNVPKSYWDFAQATWDYLESFFPEVREAEQRRRNYTPEKVEATEINTPHGTYRGGYYPIRYNLRESVAWDKEDTGALLDDARIGRFSSSHTARGHVEAREAHAGQGKKIALDPFLINSHVDRVIYDLEVGDAVTDIYKILHDTELKKAFVDTGRRHMWEQIDLWLQDAIVQELGPSSAMERGFRWVRAGTTIQALAWNVGVALIQPLGLLQSAVQLGKKNMLWGVQALLRNPTGIANLAREQSTFMATREETWNKDIIATQQVLSNTMYQKALGRKGAQFINASFFWGIKKTQRFVDLATWIAAKRDGMARFEGDEARAIEFADLMVRRSQASGLFADRTAIERGSLSRNVRQSEFVKAFTVLQSYFLAKFNVAFERTKTTNFKNPGEAFGWLTDMILLYTVEATIVALLRGEADEDEPLLETAAKETGLSVAAQFPVVREIAGRAQGFESGSTIGRLIIESGNVIEQFDQGEVDEAMFRHTNRLLGTLMHYPAGQINKTFSAYQQARRGEETRAIEFLMGPRWED